MKLRSVGWMVGVVGFACAAGAQEKGAWRATSKTAMSITGDVGFSADKLVINFEAFPFSELRPLEKPELKAIFDLDSLPEGTGHLYRIQIPATKKFLHKNTLCGSDAATWVATMVNGRELQLAFFSGSAIPSVTPEAMLTGTNLCGTYLYTR